MRPSLFVAIVVVVLSALVPNAFTRQQPITDPDVPVALSVPSTLRAPARSQSDRGAAALRAAAPLRSAAPRTPHFSRPQPQPRTAPAPKLIREWHVLYSRSGGPSTTQQSNAAPCPRATTCDRYELKKAVWPTDPDGNAVIPFAYNDDGRRRTRAADGIAHPALRAATSQWSRWNSNVAFRDTGSTTASFAADGEDGSCDDGTNVITWRTFSPDVIGAAVLCFDESGRVIRDADLALNAAQHWERVSGEPESRHSHDIQSIFTHELGHWLGFEDLYSGDALRQTMFGNTEYGETNKRTLALGDVVGIQKAYPCADGDRCPRSGIVDD